MAKRTTGGKGNGRAIVRQVEAADAELVTLDQVVRRTAEIRAAALEGLRRLACEYAATVRAVHGAQGELLGRISTTTPAVSGVGPGAPGPGAC